jgi:hypothetical protein
MTEQKRFTKTVLFSLFIVVFLTIINLASRLKDESLFRYKKSQNTESEYHKEYYYRIINQQFSVFMNEGRDLSIPFIFEGSDTLQSVLFSEYIHSHHLILYFSGDMCTPCINYCIRKIEEYFPDYKNSDNILFLAKSIDYRYRESFYGKPILCITDNNYHPINLNVPFYFVINQDMQVELLFIPDEQLPEYTDIYLGAVKSRFFAHAD